MSENVVSLRGGEVSNDRRDRFVQAVAATFDKYVKDYGVEPDAMVYIMGGIKQRALIGWDINGESTEGTTSFLALAAVHMTTEAGSTRTSAE